MNHCSNNRAFTSASALPLIASLALASASHLSLAAQVQAEESRGDVSEMRATSGANGSDGSGALAEDRVLQEVVISSTALGNDDRHRDVPPLKTGEISRATIEEPTVFASVAKREVLGSSEASGGAVSLASKSPGVVLREQGLNQPTAISLRGSSSEQVSVRIDGMAMNALRGGGFDLSLIPPAFIEKITVVRGAVGSRYGSGALGGAVDVELIQPAPGEHRFFGEVGGGSFTTLDGALGSAFSLGNTSFLVGASARHSDGNYPFDYDPTPLDNRNDTWRRVRENNTSDRLGGIARVKHERNNLRWELFVQGDGGVRGIPGSIQAPTRSAEQQDANAMVLAKLEVDGSAGLSLEGKIGGRVGFLKWLPDRNVSESWQDEESGNGEFFLRKEFERHVLSAGVKAGFERLDGPDHGTHSRFAGAAHVEDELEVGSFTLTGALRVDQIGTHTGLSPKIGVSASPEEWMTLSANAGRSFRAPSFGELFLEQGSVSPNSELTPETATFGDLGFIVNLVGSGASSLETKDFQPGMPWGLRLAIDAFVTRYDDLILYELYAPMRVKPYNLGKSLVFGGELEAEAVAKIGPNDLRLTLAGTLSRSRNDGGDERYDGNALPFHPQVRFTGRIEWRLLERFDLFSLVEFQGRQEVNRSNTDSLAGHWRWDAGLTVLIHKRSALRVGALVRNITNSQGQDVYGYPLTGRSFHATLGFDVSWKNKLKQYAH